MERASLAIDLGAESGRGILAHLVDDRLQCEELHRFTNAPVRLPSGLHWDILGLLREIRHTLGTARERCRDRGLELASLGVDAWGVDYGLVGRSGELLGYPFAYRDKRCERGEAKLYTRVPQENVYARTGIQFLPFNTLAQLVAHQEDEPELLANAGRLLFIPDLLHYLLTGECAVEATIASTSQMIDARTGEWARDLVEAAGIPGRMLGPVLTPSTLLGRVRSDIDSAGLDVILPASHDTASAVAAVPAEPGTSWCYLSSGTWSLLGAEIDAPCLSDEARNASFTNERGADGTIRFLKNIAGLWLVQQARRSLAENRSYEELESLARSASPFRTIVDPDDPCFHYQGEMTSKLADYAARTRQPVPQDAGEVVRCYLESLALAYRCTLETLERLLDRRFDVIHVIGGGSRNALLNQMTADATGRRVIAGPAEATAMGNALVQSMGRGEISGLAEARRIVAASTTLSVYEPAPEADWGDAISRFEGVCGER